MRAKVGSSMPCLVIPTSRKVRGDEEGTGGWGVEREVGIDQADDVSKKIFSPSSPALRVSACKTQPHPPPYLAPSSLASLPPSLSPLHRRDPHHRQDLFRQAHRPCGCSYAVCRRPRADDRRGGGEAAGRALVEKYGACRHTRNECSHSETLAGKGGRKGGMEEGKEGRGCGCLRSWRWQWF